MSYTVNQIALFNKETIVFTLFVSFFLLTLRVVPGWGETRGRGGEPGSLRGEADEGGDVEERAETRTPHEVSPTQQ